MTELMKRYEAETGKMATFVYTHLNNAGQEQSEEITTAEYHFWAVGKAEQLFEENAKLKAQLTWRPVSEPPKELGIYLVRVRFYEEHSTLYTVIAYFDGTAFPFHDALEWLPIPPAPEGEVK